MSSFFRIRGSNKVQVKPIRLRTSQKGKHPLTSKTGNNAVTLNGKIFFIENCKCFCGNCN